MKEKFNQKQINIFNGVLILSSQGKDLRTITVQDIATAANVGKGTVYEYFKSKEEIIASTIMYTFIEKNKQTKVMIATKDTFKDKIYVIYDLILDSANDSLSLFNLISSSGGFNAIQDYAKFDDALVKECIKDSTDIFKKVLLLGMKEKAIKVQFDIEYIELVLSANILSVGKGGMKLLSCDCNKDYIKLKDDAYKMLIKSLN